MQYYDACRLMALNLFSIVMKPFTNEANIDFEKLYEIAYIQQRLADVLVDLELEYILRIINKIDSDPEPAEIKAVESNLWKKVYYTTNASRRTGCGFTALGDMLAALNISYGSERSVEIIEAVMQTKMRAELDATIDLAILRGPFEGWNAKKEWYFSNPDMGGDLSRVYIGKNDWYKMLLKEFPEQALKMMDYGRRNVSFSTVAPTGSVSILTQTTSGLEPLFQPFYMRRKKINPSDKDVRVDFVDQLGDKWQEFAVLHPKFKDWINKNYVLEENHVLKNEDLQIMFEKSPWYQSTANDINWEQRIKIQSVIQHYTTNAISSTVNLPNDVTKEEVAKIYSAAYKHGLKGVTVYRDGCRTGVLVNQNSIKNIHLKPFQLLLLH